MNTDLDAIQARTDAATEGPWTVDSFHDVVRPGMPADYIDTAGIIQDANFIAAARTDVPALLALVRSQQAQIERVEELHKPIESGHPQIVGPVCEGCSDVDDLQFTFYPCETIAALTATEATA